MYNKQMYGFDTCHRPVPVRIRNYSEADFAGLIHIQRECFPPPFPPELWWKEEQLLNHTKLFPEGAVCIDVDGKPAGSITGLLTDFDPGHLGRSGHSWAEATDNGYIRNHNPHGRTLYIVDISVMPAYRKWGLGKMLMQAMYELVIHRDLDRLLGGGRISGFHRHADEMSAEQYVSRVMAGDLRDPVITFLLRCGRTPLGLVADYLEDAESHNYALLMEWQNPFRSSVMRS